MKIVLYELNADGTIPAWIVTGGFYPVENSLEAPQDLTMIGIADDASPVAAFASKDELKTYLTSVSGGWQRPSLDNPDLRRSFSASDASTKLWSLLA